MFAYVKYTRRKSWAPDAFSLSVMIGLAAAYFLAALLGLRLQIPGTNASPVWPPTGIALAGLLIFGRRAWVGVAVGAFAANFVTLPQELALNLKIGTSATISIGNTLEAIVAFWLISRSQNTIYLERASDVFRYFVAISVACLLSATIGTACVCAWVIGNWSPFADIWTTWWLGDVAGGIVVGAFVLVWAEFFRQSAKLEKARETSLLLLGVAFATHAIFSAMTGSLLDSLPYLLFAGPLWSAFRLGLRQTITVIFVISAISVLHTVDGSGPFFHPAPGSPLASFDHAQLYQLVHSTDRDPALQAALAEVITQALIVLQIFVCTLAVVGAYIASAVKERDLATAKFRELNRGLEAHVQARTIDLAAANERLSLHTAELSRSNQLLDQFAHAASHDLRSPLRAIAMLAHWIEEDGESQLSLDSRENIKLLRKRIVRLDALLNGLLQYAKVGRVDTLVEDVDTGATIREIIDLLPNPHDLEIRVEGVLPKIQTFRAPFAQVIRNVVGNAIEHHGGTSGLISICAIDLCNGFVEFRVSDDGRGIDEAFHERVFRIFETINKRDLHESSGVGLAMVKSIVESVGGKVRLESALSRGTCVFVTWPKDCAPAVVEAA